jgi:uncharacterized Zn finger protein
MNQEITCPQCGDREILANKKSVIKKDSQTFTHHECGKQHKFHVAAAGSGKALFQPCDCHDRKSGVADLSG